MSILAACAANWTHNWTQTGRIMVKQYMCDQVNSSFRQLQVPPHRTAALLQPDGGVLRATQAAAAARQLATNAGVMIRDGLSLRGWRDRGSAFELRASSVLSPDGLTCLYEAEVVLLVPGAWTQHCLDLWGLTLGGLEVRQVICSQAGVSDADQLQQLPLLHFWGAAAAADDPQQPEGFTLLHPGTAAAGTRVTLQQGAPWGVPVASPFDWQQVVTGAQQQQQEQQMEGAAAGSSWVDVQLQHLNSSCAGLLRGLAPPQHPSCSSSTSLATTTADGRPLLGWHPGFEAGRVVVACGATGRQPFGPGSSSSSYQFSPMLAKLAADLIKTGGSGSSSNSGGGSNVGQGDTVMMGVSLQREAVGADSSSLEGLDAWDGLGRLQQPHVASAVEIEEQQDLARDAEQDLVGTRQ